MCKLVDCLSCKHYAFWDGDPSCVSGMKIIMPDIKRECDEHKQCSLIRHALNIDIWNKARDKWMKENLLADSSNNGTENLS